ncbi:MAG: hypothetical protein AB4372_31245 [Xenococcus sp. (in: cyanobacteria)]
MEANRKATLKLSYENYNTVYHNILVPPITTETAIAVNSNLEKAQQLHHEAHQLYFISNFVNFPVFCQSLISLESN